MKTKRAGLELKGVTSNFGAGESVCTMYERNEEPSTLTTVNHQELRRRSVARPTCFNANRRHFAQSHLLDHKRSVEPPTLFPREYLPRVLFYFIIDK